MAGVVHALQHSPPSNPASPPASPSGIQLSPASKHALTPADKNVKRALFDEKLNTLTSDLDLLQGKFESAQSNQDKRTGDILIAHDKLQTGINAELELMTAQMKVLRAKVETLPQPMTSPLRIQKVPTIQ